ncbi:MAG: response regulator [Myxococcota bacterium]|nr:response regulator [Myxococcota bacterium]MDW8362427.1 response regulator [Myxococcales bacterium]
MKQAADAGPCGPILVVDDDPTTVRALAQVLRTEGYEVLEAFDGPSALELCREHEPSMIVLDYMMPGMDGETVLAMLRAELDDRAPPAVLVTPGGAAQRRASRLGAVVGLEKPFVVEELLGVIASHLAAVSRGEVN